jgi:glucose uptake protein GlcU
MVVNFTLPINTTTVFFSLLFFANIQEQRNKKKTLKKNVNIFIFFLRSINFLFFSECRKASKVILYSIKHTHVRLSAYVQELLLRDKKNEKSSTNIINNIIYKIKKILCLYIFIMIIVYTHTHTYLTYIIAYNI